MKNGILGLIMILSAIGLLVGFATGALHSKTGMQKTTAKVVEIGSDDVVVYTSIISNDLERKTYFIIPKDRLIDFNRSDSTATYFIKDADKVDVEILLN